MKPSKTKRHRPILEEEEDYYYYYYYYFGDLK
jgi:hypothetical protein